MKNTHHEMKLRDVVDHGHFYVDCQIFRPNWGQVPAIKEKSFFF